MPRSKADAAFVFEGSVIKTSASNVSCIPASKSTALVQVNHVRSAPRSLAGMAGRQVTLQIASGETLKKGESATFYTDGLVFEENIAVQSLGHESLHPTEATAAIASASPVVDRLSRRIEGAEMIVSGKVTSVRPARCS